MIKSIHLLNASLALSNVNTLPKQTMVRSNHQQHP